MKRKRFSTERIVTVLKQHEMEMAVQDLIRQVGITEQTFYRWKRQYGGLESDQIRELKQVAEENARLKRLVAELSLDKAVLQDVLSKNSPARGHERGRGVRSRVAWLLGTAGLFFDLAASLDPAAIEPTRSSNRTAAKNARTEGQRRRQQDRGRADPLWATGGCMFCFGAGDRGSGGTLSTGSIARKASRCESRGRDVARWSSRVRRAPCRRRRTRPGRWNRRTVPQAATSCTINSLTVPSSGR